MKISDDLHCLFSATLQERRDSYVIEVPKQEVETGNLDPGSVYRVAMLGAEQTQAVSTETASNTTTESAPEPESNGGANYADPEPPVESGETRTVEIENIGDQGDGIARVERGYVVVVPDTEKGEKVTIEVNDVKQSVAFAEVLKRHDYYE